MSFLSSATAKWTLLTGEEPPLDRVRLTVSFTSWEFRSRVRLNSVMVTSLLGVSCGEATAMEATKATRGIRNLIVNVWVMIEGRMGRAEYWVAEVLKWSRQLERCAGKGA